MGECGENGGVSAVNHPEGRVMVVKIPIVVAIYR